MASMPFDFRLLPRTVLTSHGKQAGPARLPKASPSHRQPADVSLKSWAREELDPNGPDRQNNPARRGRKQRCPNRHSGISFDADQKQPSLETPREAFSNDPSVPNPIFARIVCRISMFVPKSVKRTTTEQNREQPPRT